MYLYKCKACGFKVTYQGYKPTWLVVCPECNIVMNCHDKKQNIKGERIKLQTANRLKEAYEMCESEKRSIEYTIQFMQDYVGVSHDCVLNWMYENRD